MRSPSRHASAGLAAGALRLARWTGWILALLLALAAADLVLRLEGDVLAGPARIIDGDSIEIEDTNIRLAGLDAPERAQVCEDARGEAFGCGTAATDYLRFLIDGAPVTCRGRGRDRYGRLIARCRVGGTDLSEAMVRRGWAVAYLGDLDALEAEARAGGVGLWAGTFERPADWRRAKRRASLLVSPVALAREGIAALATRLRGERPARAPADG